jgi:hypothetical protein
MKGAPAQHAARRKAEPAREPARPAPAARAAPAGALALARALGNRDYGRWLRAAPDGLPEALRAGLESVSGRDLSGVRVHYGSPRPAQLEAHAYTRGSDIHLAPGQERHLPHEGWHAVQQMEGRVRPTLQLRGTPVSDDAALEREAEVMGARAARRGAARQQARAAAPAGRAAPASGGAVQRVKIPREVLSDLLLFYRGELLFLRRTISGHPLAQGLTKTAYQRHAGALLEILREWTEGSDARLASARTWSSALQAAKRELNRRRAEQQRTPEEGAKRQREMAALQEGFGGGGEKVDESTLQEEEKEKYGKMFPLFLDEASQSTDVFTEPLPVRRRKLHKEGQVDLPGYEVRYRSYKGYISPKPNAFVMGELAQDYGPLLRELVAAAAVETAAQEKPFDDRAVARLFLREFEGENAFAGFAPETQRLAHKVIAIIFFAELSRHSIALLTAAAGLDAVARRGDEAAKPGLVESFETGSEEMRPLFAGTGGAELMRGGLPADMSKEAVAKRRLRATIDIRNYFTRTGKEGEKLEEFIRRRTLDFLFNLAANTDERTVKTAEMDQALYRYLRRVRPAERGADPLVTLAGLGFTRWPMGGDENDCAIRTLHDQLQRRGYAIGFEAFRDHVRQQPGVGAFGSMIDILNNGGALLAAVQDYIVNVLHQPAPALAIDAWVATPDGALMEYQNVARRNGGGGGDLVMTFYFNGVNHFDSLTGGLAR